MGGSVGGISRALTCGESKKDSSKPRKRLPRVGLKVGVSLKFGFGVALYIELGFGFAFGFGFGFVIGLGDALARVRNSSRTRLGFTAGHVDACKHHHEHELEGFNLLHERPVLQWNRRRVTADPALRSNSTIVGAAARLRRCEGLRIVPSAVLSARCKNRWSVDYPEGDERNGHDDREEGVPHENSRHAEVRVTIKGSGARQNVVFVILDMLSRARGNSAGVCF